MNNHAVMWRLGRIMLILLSVILGCTVIAAGALLFRSPGRVKPFVDGGGKPLAGSISEKTFVDINGVRQGMFIEGRDIANPVLLFLHGGTAMPQHFLSLRYPTGLENYATVCYWERRGAGLSYRKDIPPGTLTVEQHIADTIAVTDYLRERFHKDKIFLLGHSGGSFIGIQAAARAPELYHAFIGIAQMSHQIASEVMSYRFMLEQYRQRGDTRMVRLLEESPVTMSAPMPESYLRVRDKAMHSLGVGTTREMRSVITGLFLPSLVSPEYTIREKIQLWRGKFASDAVLRDTFTATDLTRTVTSLNLPVYFLHGRHDYTCCYPLAKAYLQDIAAPLKGFYTFEESAHSPLYEEPEKFIRILREDVLTGSAALADVPGTFEK